MAPKGRPHLILQTVKLICQRHKYVFWLRNYVSRCTDTSHVTLSTKMRLRIHPPMMTAALSPLLPGHGSRAGITSPAKGPPVGSPISRSIPSKFLRPPMILSRRNSRRIHSHPLQTSFSSFTVLSTPRKMTKPTAWPLMLGTKHARSWVLAS